MICLNTDVSIRNGHLKPRPEVLQIGIGWVITDQHVVLHRGCQVEDFRLISTALGELRGVEVGMQAAANLYPGTGHVLLVRNDDIGTMDVLAGLSRNAATHEVIPRARRRKPDQIARVRELEKCFPLVIYEWVPREMNVRAHRQAGRAFEIQRMQERPPRPTMTTDSINRAMIRYGFLPERKRPR